MLFQISFILEKDYSNTYGQIIYFSMLKLATTIKKIYRLRL